MPPTFVIVGASLAGATAAATLRKDGFDGAIVLIGAEPHAPYERPLLSKQYLRGEVPFEKALVRPAAFFDDQRIETRFGTRATGVLPLEQSVTLDSGQRVHYDKLLIATGVRNRRPPIPGLTLDGVFDLRTVDDADALREEIRPGRRAAVIGMGFIGCEVAASLRQKGVDVVSVDPSPAPLFRVLGEQVAQVMARIHQDHGVETIFGDVVSRFDGERRVARIITQHGRRIDCDFAVVGVGVEPVTDFLRDSGMALDNGIAVDEYCRTSIPGVHAAGDIANHYHPAAGRRLRVEHWQNAMQQGAAAARTMLGSGQPYDPVHWFWSDQYDTNVQYASVDHTWDQVVIRGSLDARTFLAFYLNQGRLHAVASMNRGKDLRRVMALLKTRPPVDANRLRDEGVDLRDLVQALLPGQ
jgi:3-phenylpropionate/trans-cinnamate dioxygenase ferredoxin reductase subunit